MPVWPAMFGGTATRRFEYVQVSWIFLRLLSLIYFAAFLSLYVQIDGLIGPQGILPAGQFLHHAYAQGGWVAVFQIPTIFWINSDTFFLKAIALAGGGLSVMLFFARKERLSLILMFVFYLSLLHAGQRFMNFQWDYLLLEVGFLSIFLVSGISPLLLFLFHWLLFRLRFLSGLSKLLTEDPSWINLDALKYYFETQPLPHVGSWYAHYLPDSVLRFGTGFTLFAELVVPFFIFLPRPFRITAAFITIGFQLLIIATSNHNFFNLLTILLCLFLLDDRFVSRFLPAWMLRRVKADTKDKSGLPTRVAAVLIMFGSLCTAATMAGVQLPGVLFAPMQMLGAYGLGNAYHVFPIMQTMREELIIEGSYDGYHWQPYRFRYKPDWLDKPPAFVVPHQPRLDAMMWFVPTKAPVMMNWFQRFLQGLYENRPAVTSLLENNPFQDRPPRYIRVLAFQYRFSTPLEREQTGDWWHATYLGEFPYIPPRVP